MTRSLLSQLTPPHLQGEEWDEFHVDLTELGRVRVLANDSKDRPSGVSAAKERGRKKKKTA